MDPVVLFERAATGAVSMTEQVRPEQRQAPTPCTEWDVEALLEHMVGGTGYLLSALGLENDPVGADSGSCAEAVSRCLGAVREAGALEGRCMSPAGFEWSVGDAVAGTAMDQLIHTWDLAVAIPADAPAQDRLLGAMGRRP